MYFFSTVLALLIGLPFLLFLVTPVFIGLTFGWMVGESRRSSRIVKRPRILIVDDEVSSVLPLMTVLENGATDVHYVSNGQDMIRELASRAYDLVFLDSKMPEMSGEKTLEQGDEVLRLDRPVPVIFYSGSAPKVDVPKNLKHFDIKGVWSKDKLASLERDVANVVQPRHIASKTRRNPSQQQSFYNQT